MTRSSRPKVRFITSVKWYHRQQKEYVQQVAVDLFGSVRAMKEHFRRCKTRYNAYLCFLQSRGVMGCDANEEYKNLPPEEKEMFRHWVRGTLFTCSN